MAKNKNRKQAGPQNRASRNEPMREHTQRSSEEPESAVSQIQGGPADAAGKKRRSFGHN